MYHSNGIQDSSFFLFSDNMCTNPTSTNDDFSSSSLLNAFPSSRLIDFNDEAGFFQDFHSILHQHNDNNQEMVAHEGADDMHSNKNSNVKNKKKKLSNGGCSKVLREQIRVNRRCKKDRHSKITTANGCSRGRRMRLSLKVAKEFFGLQDMLGHDKASKTVEWLLTKSENAIKEVTTMNHSPCPSASVVSATDELEPEITTKEKMKGGTQKVGASYPFTRGLREKARARARERTLKKKRLQLVGGFTENDRSRLYNCSQGMNIGSDYSSPGCNKFAAAGNKFVNMNTNDPAPVLEVEDILNYNKPQQPHSFEGSINTEELIIDHSFFISNNWNPYTIFNLHHNSGTTS